MTYIVTMCLAVCLSIPLQSKKDNKKKKTIEKFCFFLSFLILLLPHALRYGIGTDYFYTYVPYFKWIGNGTKFYKEIIFTLLNKLIYDLTGDYRVLFFVCSFIFFYLMYRVIKKYSENISMSILLIFLLQIYFYSMNAVRQALAMAIILNAFELIKENKKIKFILICIIASMIHTSALTMIPLVFICNMNISRKKQIILMISIGGLSTVIGEILQSLIIKYTKYGWYYSSVFIEEKVSAILLLTNFLIFILNIMYFPTKDKEDKSYKILTNINFCAMCLIMVSNFIPLVSRLIKYFTMFQVLLLPSIFRREKKAKNRMLIEFIVLSFLVATMFYQIYFLGGEEVLPYRSIFNIGG